MWLPPSLSQTSDIDDRLPAPEWWERQVFARFGLAIYLCQALELQLVNHLTILHLNTGLDQAGIDRLLQRWFARTMGSNIREVNESLAVSLGTATLLDDALQRRNWLTHHYFRSRAVKLGTIKGKGEIARELDVHVERLQHADAALSAETTALATRQGLSRETLAAGVKEWTDAARRSDLPHGFDEWHALFGDREPT